MTTPIGRNDTTSALGNVNSAQAVAPRSGMDSLAWQEMGSRINALESEIVSFLRTIEQRNKQLEQAVDALTDLQAQRRAITDDNSPEAKRLEEEIQQHKAVAQSLSNLQQTDTLRLRALSDGHRELLEWLSTVIKKVAEAKTGIVTKTG